VIPSYQQLEKIIFNQMNFNFSWMRETSGNFQKRATLSYLEASSQNITSDDIEVENQLRNASATETWYFWHSSPKWQCPRS